MMKSLFNAARPLFKKSREIYKYLEKYTPLLSFAAGFGWDSATLSRIDRLVDNLILLTYIALLGFIIVLFNLVEKGVPGKPIWYKYKSWYPLAIQFLFGGLFSAYVIFYSQSAAFTKTDLFLALLVILLISTEFLKELYRNIYAEMTLYFLACFSFLTFFLPVITREISLRTFLAGGLISLLILIGLVLFLYYHSALKSREQMIRLWIAIGVAFGLVNLFYWLNWIPPVPLSVKSAGIYHRVVHDGESYHLFFEQPEWYQRWRNYDAQFHHAPGDTVFCFASIFAPTALNTDVYHRWQKYLPTQKQWITTDRLRYQITGGRDGGYRGYTFKKRVTPGQWRVDVETSNHKLLSRINFRIEPVEGKNYILITTER